LITTFKSWPVYM